MELTCGIIFIFPNRNKKRGKSKNKWKTWVLQRLLTKSYDILVLNVGPFFNLSCTTCWLRKDDLNKRWRHRLGTYMWYKSRMRRSANWSRDLLTLEMAEKIVSFWDAWKCSSQLVSSGKGTQGGTSILWLREGHQKGKETLNDTANNHRWIGERRKSRWGGLDVCHHVTPHPVCSEELCFCSLSSSKIFHVKHLFSDSGLC